MKKYIYLTTFALILSYIHPNQSIAQSVLKLGKTTIQIQSPIKVENKADSILEFSCKTTNPKKFRPRTNTEFYVGMGFATRTENNTLPIYYGDSYNLDIGLKYIYRPARWYALGSLFQFGFNNYKTDGLAKDGTLTGTPIEKNIYKEYYRTNNLGIGIFNRFYLVSNRHSSLFIDIGAYGDWAYSKRVRLKTSEGKDKLRDGRRFNPLQGGLYGAVGYGCVLIFAKYRLSNYFNPSKIPQEFDRLNIGLQFEF